MKVQWALTMILAASGMAFGQMPGTDMPGRPAHNGAQDRMAMPMSHEHASGAPVSYAELKQTVAQLEAARRATEKYRDVRAAETGHTDRMFPAWGFTTCSNAERRGSRWSGPRSCCTRRTRTCRGAWVW